MTRVFFRAASILLVIFAALHTAGFRQVDPQWGVDALITSMRSIRFDIMGSHRTYWELFVGFGLFFSVFLVFAAVVAWQLSNLPRHTLANLRGVVWALPICAGAVTIVSLRFAFLAPILFSVLITLCLTVAAWLSTRD